MTEILVKIHIMKIIVINSRTGLFPEDLQQSQCIVCIFSIRLEANILIVSIYLKDFPVAEAAEYTDCTSAES